MHRRVPDVDDGAIASREPVATSTRDLQGAGVRIGFDDDRRRLDARASLLGDVSERGEDFQEWRMDYSRQLAKCVPPARP